MNIPISIQMYSLRSETEKDFFGTLKTVKELGFDGVELAGFFGVDSLSLKNELDCLGLVVTGSHTPISELKDDIDAAITYNKVIGNRNIIIPFAELNTDDEVRELHDFIIEIAPKIASNGMKLFYHNHEKEFEKIDGKHILDYFLEDEPTLHLQLDICWATKAGINPSVYLKKYAGRTDLCHIKDIDGDTLVAVGEGEVDIESALKTAASLSMSAIVYENDDPKPDAITNARISIENIKKLINK